MDWDTLAWNPGDTTNSFDIDPGTPGNDVTVDVGGQANVFTNDVNTGLITPNIGTAITGGLSPVENSFEIAANLKTVSKVTISVNFTALYTMGVRDVTFSLYDIDITTNADQIKGIYGIALDGTHIAATITGVGSNVTLSGSGLTQVLTGNASTPNSGPGSDLSNATISFGSTAITGFVFTFANNAGAPRYQDIAMGDIFFTPIPEIDPALPVFLLAFVAAVVSQFRKRQS